jgi:ligand-binding sensor domain-containing protein
MSKKIVYLILLCFIFFTNTTKVNAENSSAQPIKILTWKQLKVIVYPNQIRFYNKKNLVEKTYSTPYTLYDAAILQNGIWLATAQGLRKYEIDTWQEKKHYFQDQKIVALDKDVQDKLWVATSLQGVYQQNEKDSFEQRLNVMATYTLTCTADSNTYIGTNIGLYKLHQINKTLTRYAEEGHSGHELPDNIVEKLYKDATSNIWVLMPDNISFKSSQTYTGEIPSYAYIGDKKNTITNIVDLGPTAYLIVTKKGLVILPNHVMHHNHQHGTSEIFQESNIEAYAANPSLWKIKAELEQDPIVYAEKTGNHITFVTNKDQVYTVAIKKIVNSLPKVKS